MTSLSPLAYLKVVLHAAKYPANTVIGLLVGTVDAASSTCTVSDAIPLVHAWTDLSPMTEAALQLVRESLQLLVVVAGWLTPLLRSTAGPNLRRPAATSFPRPVRRQRATERPGDPTWSAEGCGRPAQTAPASVRPRSELSGRDGKTLARLGPFLNHPTRAGGQRETRCARAGPHRMFPVPFVRPSERLV